MRFKSEEQRKAVVAKFAHPTGKPVRRVHHNPKPGKRKMVDPGKWRRDAAEDLESARADLQASRFRRAFEGAYISADKYAKSRLKQYDPEHSLTLLARDLRAMGVPLPPGGLEEAADYDALYQMARYPDGSLSVRETDARKMIRFAEAIERL